MKSAQKTCVLVAGMHRSGTSALTRVLNILGCDLPKQVIGADTNNQTGYWEPASINALNDQLLESAGSTWDDCTPCTPGWFQSPLADEFRDRCGSLLDAEYGNSRLTVLKEPRICRLLPFWLDVIESKGIEPLVILPIRNPLAVADSLAKRDFSDPFYNYHLWLRHVLDAERGSRGKKRFFCGYDDLIDSWSSVISKSQTVLSFKWPRLSPKASEEIDNYIASSYRHHVIAPAKVLNDTSLPYWLRTTYEIMLNWIENGENPEDYKQLDEVCSGFDLACSSFARILYRGKSAQAALRNLQVTAGQRDEALNEANHQVGALASELNGMRATVAEMSETRNIHADRINELEAAHQAALAESATLTHDRDTLTGHITELEAAHQAVLAESAAVTHDRDTLASRINELEAAHQAALAESATLTHDRDTLASRINELEEAYQSALSEKTELNQGKNHLISKCTELEHLIERLQGEYDSLTGTLAQKEALLSKADQEHTAAQEHIAALHVEIKERDLAVQNERAVQEADLGMMQARLDEVQREFIEQTSHLISQAEAENKAHQSIVIGLEASINELKASLSISQDERQLSEVAVQGLKAHLDLLIGDLEEATRANDDLKLNFNDIAEKLNSDIAAVKAERDSALAFGQAEQSAHHRTVIALETSINELKASLSIAQNDAKSADKVAKGLKAHFDLLVGDLEEATRANDDLKINFQGLAERLNSDIASVMTERDSALDQLVGLSAKLEQSHQQSGDLLQTQMEMEAKIAATQSDASALKTNIKALELSLMQSNAIVEGLKQHVHLLLADVEANAAELESEKANQAGLWRIIDQVQGDLSAAEAREIQLRDRVEDLEGNLAQTASELRQRQAETDDLNRELQAAKDALAAEQLKAQSLSTEKTVSAAQMAARITQLEQDLAQREHEMAQSTAALDALKTSFARQEKEHQSALRDKETVTIAMIDASRQATEKLRGQVTALVRGLADEKHVYFMRKSAAIQRKAALLVESGVLDVDWYLSSNTDVAASGVDAGVHYLMAGLAEGRALSSH